MYTLAAVGAVLDGPGSGMVMELVVHASPEAALLPLTVLTAISTSTVPLPVLGAVQSKDQER